MPGWSRSWPSGWSPKAGSCRLARTATLGTPCQSGLMANSTVGSACVRLRRWRDLVGTSTLFAKGNELADLLAQTIRDGYRLLDTAAQYANEGEVGEAIRRSRVPRNEILLTTKVAGMDRGHHPDPPRARRIAAPIEHRLCRSPADPLAQPSRGLAVETWAEMLELQAEGLVPPTSASRTSCPTRSRVHARDRVWPVVDQIQLSPRWPAPNCVPSWPPRGIVAQGWRPLGGHEQPMGQIITVRSPAGWASTFHRWCCVGRSSRASW